MQAILGAAAEAASGTRGDEKEAPKVCACVSFQRLKSVNVFSLLTYISMCVCVLSLGPSSVFKIVKMIMERNFQPVIIFSFSKKECEAYALQVAKLDFNRGMCAWAVIQHTAVLSSQRVCVIISLRYTLNNTPTLVQFELVNTLALAVYVRPLNQ